MPTNLYGPGDNYDLNTSHVLPALIRKMHEATTRGDKEVVVWGTGAPRREFLFSDDMADACAHVLGLPDGDFDALLTKEDPPLLNIGSGEDLTIAELAQAIARVVGFGGELRFDPAKPDGTPQKLLDTSRINALSWRARTSLHAGIEIAYRDFANTHVA
jgi:GDP-L-fucose synthase